MKIIVLAAHQQVDRIFDSVLTALMPNVTRTIGPLHLEDLEPHRFEDLVRQLIYDFRSWQTLEATGRQGGDDGFDVRAIEAGSSTTLLDAEADSDPPYEAEHPHRVWLIQCKREMSIGPAKIEKYLRELPGPEDGLYGLLFAAACDFSKAARDRCFAVARERGFAEVHLWGKAELEDALFQPKNDHLLFAYFGISLQVRRRSLQTRVRARLATKKKSTRVLHPNQHVLVIDASDDRYPYADPGEDQPWQKRRSWQVWQFGEVGSRGITVLLERSFAYIADDGIGWDRADKVNDARASFDNPWLPRDRERITKNQIIRSDAMTEWEAFPEANRAWFELEGHIPFDAILAIDDDGDHHFRGPHIYVQQWDSAKGPFSHFTSSLEGTDQFSPRWARPVDGTRLAIFSPAFRD